MAEGHKYPPIIVNEGEKLYKRPNNKGRPRAFDTPEDIWDAAIAYFEWVERNPLWEAKLVSFQGISTVEQLPKMRAMTLMGFWLHSGVNKDTWYRYKNDSHYREVCENVEYHIREQKFSGAAAGLLNPIIIARDLGLSEKHEVTGADGGAIRTESITAAVTQQDAAEAYQRMIKGE